MIGLEEKMFPVYFASYSSPLGKIFLAANTEGLCGAWLENQAHFEEKLAIRLGISTTDLPHEDLKRNAGILSSPYISRSCTWLDAYFAGEIPTAFPPFSLHGTTFQEEVWAQLTQIPYGRRITYGALAQQIENQQNDGKRVSPRAVGAAVARNPISIIIPCHRVIGANGSLTGYAGGVERKQKLLDFEQKTMKNLMQKGIKI